jgi:hypothetical protein
MLMLCACRHILWRLQFNMPPGFYHPRNTMAMFPNPVAMCIRCSEDANSEIPFCYFIGDLYGLDCSARLNLEFFHLWWVPTHFPLGLCGRFPSLFKRQQRLCIFVWVSFGPCQLVNGDQAAPKTSLKSIASIGWSVSQWTENTQLSFDDLRK